MHPAQCCTSICMFLFVFFKVVTDNFSCLFFFFFYKVNNYCSYLHIFFLAVSVQASVFFPCCHWDWCGCDVGDVKGSRSTWAKTEHQRLSLSSKSVLCLRSLIKATQGSHEWANMFSTFISVSRVDLWNKFGWCRVIQHVISNNMLSVHESYRAITHDTEVVAQWCTRCGLTASELVPTLTTLPLTLLALSSYYLHQLTGGTQTRARLVKMSKERQWVFVYLNALAMW